MPIVVIIDIDLRRTKQPRLHSDRALHVHVCHGKPRPRRASGLPLGGERIARRIARADVKPYPTIEGRILGILAGLAIDNEMGAVCADSSRGVTINGCQRTIKAIPHFTKDASMGGRKRIGDIERLIIGLLVDSDRGAACPSRKVPRVGHQLDHATAEACRSGLRKMGRSQWRGRAHTETPTADKARNLRRAIIPTLDDKGVRGTTHPRSCFGDER
jgi:hypothetical protein